MAYLTKRDRSPFWHLRYRNLETGVWVRENLKLRIDDAKETAAALKQAAKKSKEEAMVSPNRGDDFGEWVPAYIESHYLKIKTRQRAHHFWSNLQSWLLSQKIRHPRELEHEHAHQYMTWRKKAGASHNTARAEVKFLSFIMKEAIRKRIAERNVLGGEIIAKKPPKEKAELDDNDIHEARLKFLGSRPEEKWCRVCFEILINLGCRFNEARIAKENINFKNLTILLVDSKRDENDPRKVFTVPMSQHLATFLQGIEWHDGFTLPEIVGGPDEFRNNHANRKFNRILKRACGATSHSCRVTFITRCHRAGLSQAEAMRLVNHSTDLVHRIYSKLNVEDARRALLKVPALPPPLPEIHEPN
jgi:site-specific recombinase XerD